MFIPHIAEAATGQTLQNLINDFSGLLSTIVPILITIIVVFTIWQAISYARAKESADREKARGRMIAGVVALAVVLSLFGIVRIVQNTFGIGGQANTTGGQNLGLPTVNP